MPTPRDEDLLSFPTSAAFEDWLSRHHDSTTEVWLKIHKKGSGLATVTHAEALDVALCWGWIDAIRKSFDERSFLQRFTPRGRKSVWSQINREHVARLVAAGRMTPHGLKQVDAAKADGRWDAAYAPIRSMMPESIPTDLREAIRADPSAEQTFGTLNRMNLFALAFRLGQAKTPDGRARKIRTLVEMLARGETIAPQAAATTKTKGAPATPKAKTAVATPKTKAAPVTPKTKAAPKTTTPASRSRRM